METTDELIKWCHKESDRNARLQGDKRGTSRRRHTFRHRNHMLKEAARQLEELQRLRMIYFFPVDERAVDRPRNNFEIINANFSSIDTPLQIVNVSVELGDDTGDLIRDAWIKVNQNFKAVEKAACRTTISPDDLPRYKDNTYYGINSDPAGEYLLREEVLDILRPLGIFGIPDPQEESGNEM